MAQREPTASASPVGVFFGTSKGATGSCDSQAKVGPKAPWKLDDWAPWNVNEFRISLRCVSHPYMCLLLRSMSLCGLDMCEYPVDGISVQRDPFSQYSLFMQGMATCE